MGLKDDLTNSVAATFRSAWEAQNATVVPAPADLRLNSNHAKQLDSATVLYADLDGSTSMVDNQSWQFSAEVYKTFLKCSSEIIRSEGGEITAYDGDRVMAIFTGGLKNTSAVKAALKINYAVKNIIRPAIAQQYPTRQFTLDHVVGVDTSTLHATRTGVRGDNDLVWVGRSANYAAKLTSLPGKPTWITKAVYDSIAAEAKFTDGKSMWEARSWTQMDGMTVYCSTWWWPLPN